MYQYSFDETRAGDWRLSRAKYEQLHECYKLILKRIEEWNQIAVAHGALEAPYKAEAQDFERMIEWGAEELGDKNRREIVVKGISVGSLRYAKAALIYGSRVRKAEAQAAERPDWPTAVRAAMQDAGKPLVDLAEKITYPPADILSEVAPPESRVAGVSAPEWDAFISHASEDKADFVETLAQELRSRDLNIWYDNFTLTVGDSLRRSIDRGLAHSKYGVVILSPSFFAKEWPQKELDGLVAREVDGRKVILPVWHKIDAAGIRAYSPILADRVAISSSRGVQAVADAIIAGMGLAGRPARTPSGDHGSQSNKGPSPIAALAPGGPDKWVITVDGHVESCEQRALGRFNALREKRIDKDKGDPFQKGYWQASFALQGQLRDISLPDFLELLRKSKTGRTGWDVGWVPTREGITPYPYQDGIEVWLAEDGGKGAGHSDFWRAERIGAFSLFRGYQEDEPDYSQLFPKIQLDFSLALWRIAEFLLYLESFSGNLASGPARANIRVRWTGLENRQLGYHKAFVPPLQNHVCHQPLIETQLHLPDTTAIRRTLAQNVRSITRALFEAFDFFAVTEEQIKQLLQGVFDTDRESGI